MLSVIIITKNEEAHIVACLQSVQFADEIIVLENGSIKERGTHEALLALRGLYFETYAAQYMQAKQPGMR